MPSASRMATISSPIWSRRWSASDAPPRHDPRRGERGMQRLAFVLSMLIGLAACSSGAPRPPAAETAEPAVTAANERTLHGSAWLLEDLGGADVLDGAEATLTFPEAGRVAGNGSCNSFSGRAAIGAGTIRIGPLVSTRRACPPAIM